MNQTLKFVKKVDTETGICASVKSKFYFRFHWPESMKCTLINFNSVQIFCDDLWNNDAKNWNIYTSKIHYILPNQSIIYFWFVSEIIGVDPTMLTDTQTHRHKNVITQSIQCIGQIMKTGELVQVLRLWRTTKEKCAQKLLSPKDITNCRRKQLISRLSRNVQLLQQ